MIILVVQPLPVCEADHLVTLGRLITDLVHRLHHKRIGGQAVEIGHYKRKVGSAIELHPVRVDIVALDTNIIRGWFPSQVNECKAAAGIFQIVRCSRRLAIHFRFCACFVAWRGCPGFAHGPYLVKIQGIGNQSGIGIAGHVGRSDMQELVRAILFRSTENLEAGFIQRGIRIFTPIEL